MSTHIPIENFNQRTLLVTSAISILIALVAVGLRFAAKKIRGSFDYSDYCIAVALIWNTALHTCCAVMVLGGGFGLHISEIHERFGPETVEFFFKGIMSFALLWNATVCFSKLSVLLMYTAIIPTPSMEYMVRIVAVVVIVWNSADIIAGLLICRPIARNWNFAIAGSCGSQPAFYFAIGLVNLVIDSIIISMPMPYLLGLQMARTKKALVIGLLSVGIGTWVITIYRQTLLPHLVFEDMTHSGVLATMLSGLEPAVAIVLACVPLLRPLFGRQQADSSSSPPRTSRDEQSAKCSKKGATSRTTQILADIDNDYDDSSQIELKPSRPSGAWTR